MVSKSGWPNALEDPAFRFVRDDPRLPRVLLMGDSISVYYTPYVREALAGKANVHRIPDNGGDTKSGLKNMDGWLGTSRWDVIHFNFGLHDLKRLTNGQYDAQGEQVTPPDAYAANLEQITDQLRRTKARLIWASTTPVPEGSAGRRKGDEVIFNVAAAKVMAKRHVTINDLYSLAEPCLKEMQNPNDVHFRDQGSALLGRRVAEAIGSEMRHVHRRFKRTR